MACFPNRFLSNALRGGATPRRRFLALWRVFKMGGTGDPPVPVGDPPTGMARRVGFRKRAGVRKTRLCVPSGESPDGIGQGPVPPKAILKTRPRTSSLFRHLPFVIRHFRSL